MELEFKITNIDNYDKDSLKKGLDTYIDNIPYVVSYICKAKNVYLYNSIPVMGELVSFDVDKGTILVRPIYDDHENYKKSVATIIATGQTINGKIILNWISTVLLEKR